MSFQDLGDNPTGPYFWDPARADPGKVSGTTGSHVKPWRIREWWVRKCGRTAMRLECLAGPGPITVDLVADKPEAAHPVAASVVVSAGLQSASFDVMTEQVYVKTSAVISATANGGKQSKALTVLPWASVNPATALKFGGVVVGTTSPTLSAVLTNKGTGAFAVDGIAVTGTGASWFAQTNDCPASLAPGVSCSIGVTFVPLSATRRSAKLSIATNATTAPLTVSLSGTGLPPP